jgi:type IV pilus assembly protein PilE
MDDNIETVYTAGYTLVELMITLVVTGILSMIAIPSYSEYVKRSTRIEAKVALLQAQNWMEQQFTLNSSYLNAGEEPVLPDSFSRSPISGTEKYTLSVVSGTTVASYTLQAVPVQEDKCGIFTLDQSGLRGLSGTHTATAELCWADL